MVRSDTLKSFVKMHERKLNAKLNGLRAGQLHDELLDTAAEGPGSASQHWDLSDNESGSRRRPKSQYFDFIMTAR